MERLEDAQEGQRLSICATAPKTQVRSLLSTNHLYTLATWKYFETYLDFIS